MSSLPVSEKPRKKIFDFPEVRVVEASAGSGKTYALAKRYIQLLLNPSLKPGQISMRSILAITFTNKAAFEMKARILEFLKNIALQRLSKPTPTVLSGTSWTGLPAFRSTMRTSF